MTASMIEPIVEALHELAENDAELALLPSKLIDDIVESVKTTIDRCDQDNEYVDISAIEAQIWTLHRASIERRRELEATIKATRSNVSGMVKAHGASVKAAGFIARFQTSTLIADSKRLKLDVETNALLAKYLKSKSAYCRIDRSK